MKQYDRKRIGFISVPPRLFRRTNGCQFTPHDSQHQTCHLCVYYTWLDLLHPKQHQSATEFITITDRSQWSMDQ